MILSIIVAAAENNVIGKDNGLIWRLPADMKFFKETTTGHAIITGRKNYESIPEKFRPLSDRENIVITRQENYKAPGAVVVSSIENALEYVRQHHGNEEVFIIGGAEIYKQTLSMCHKIYLTRVHHSFEGDAFFPSLNENDWQLKNSEDFKADEKNAYNFTIQTWIKKVAIS
ncbi:MAG TPA: dihydrofolate reductase [Bacteroidia bacterium]|jgi:dihydrofolate reductase|nr:dihydrofolate reductase [Bacteroidia bacterium]